MNTRKTVYNKLFTEKVELAKHEVELAVIEDLNNIGITSFLTRSFFGEFSYGKITNVIRPYPEEYSIYRNNGLLGISTSPIVRRTNALKYRNYLP